MLNVCSLGTRSRFNEDKSGHVPEDLHPTLSHRGRGIFYLHFGEFEAFQVFCFQDLPGVVQMLFYCLLESVPVGVFVCFAIFPCVDVGERVPSG